MGELRILKYDISELESLLIEISKTPLQNLSHKTHLHFFEEYFNEIDVRTVVVEYQYVDHDYLEDFSAYYVKCFNPYERFCTRLHFFKIEFNFEDFSQALLSRSSFLNNVVLNDSYLGFIVVKPIPITFIGRTCLITYPSDSGRNYPFKHLYPVNLFGLKLDVSSLAYQEQDSVVAACASTAIWSAFQATAYLFQHSVPTPVEITKAAVKLFPFSNRHFPNTGLSEEQMALAIRDVGLEPYIITASEPNIIKASIYAYQKAGIPLIMGFELFEDHNAIIEKQGKHAVAVSGYRLDGARCNFPGSTFHLLSSRISGIYVHDDQIGPFARMKFIPGDSKLSTSWPDTNGLRGYTFADPLILLIPLYNKLRIPFELILKIISKLDEILDVVDSFLHLGIGEVEWEIFLSNSNNLKEDIFKSNLDESQKLKYMKMNLPKYVWRAIAHLDGEKTEFIFDTTDIEQGKIFIGVIDYSRNLYRMIRTIAINVDLNNIGIIQLRSIFSSIRI